MLILAVDTSTRTGSAAILCNSEVLAEVAGNEDLQYSTRLFQHIARLQKAANFGIGDIDVFAVAAGPGSFTGLRVGLTAAKAWAEVHRKPIAAISGLEAIAVEGLNCDVDGPPIGGFIAPFIDARRGQIFGAIYRRVSDGAVGLEPASDESIVTTGEFLESLKRYRGQSLAFASPTPNVLPGSELEGVLPGAPIRKVSSALASSIGRLGFERARRGELVDALRLDANYIRRSDAEAAWKGG